jgi:hypothetical protein
MMKRRARMYANGILKGMKEPAVWVKQLAGWQPLLRVEPSGVRTAAAAVLPFLFGQALGYPVIGLMAGLGGLYLSITDKEGATPASLFARYHFVKLILISSLPRKGLPIRNRHTTDTPAGILNGWDWL